MKEYLKDILYCIKFSIYIFIVTFLIGVVIGIIVGGFNLIVIMDWGSRISQYVSFLGLFISALSFMSENLMRPLNYEEQWKTYFSKLNLTFVIFFISLFILIFSICIQDKVWVLTK